MLLRSHPVRQRPKFAESSLEAFPLTSTDVLLDSTEEIEIIWSYIRGIEQMKHSYEFLIERNYVVVIELCGWTSFTWRKNRFCRGILIEYQSNNIKKVFVVE
jgi:hypothetical protein